MTPTLIYKENGCEIWHGDSLNAAEVEAIMQGRKAQLLNVDAPYSEKTHAGHDAATNMRNGYRSKTPDGAYSQRHASENMKPIAYAHWTAVDVAAFTDVWSQHVTGWWCSTTDDQLAPVWGACMGSRGLYTFAPLAWVEVGSRVRLVGDGPSNWTCWLVVGRPRRKPYSNWGTLRGAYVLPAENHQNRHERITGGKSIPGTVQLIEDYSRTGELVVDPCLGGGTTVLAAAMCGRQCIGIERDLERAQLCAELMRNGGRAKLKEIARQEKMF
jgi:hypothetical protein